jgi:hypothetical protein
LEPGATPEDRVMQELEVLRAEAVVEEGAGEVVVDQG